MNPTEDREDRFGCGFVILLGAAIWIAAAVAVWFWCSLVLA